MKKEKYTDIQTGMILGITVGALASIYHNLFLINTNNLRDEEKNTFLEDFQNEMVSWKEFVVANYSKDSINEMTLKLFNIPLSFAPKEIENADEKLFFDIFNIFSGNVDGFNHNFLLQFLNDELFVYQDIEKKSLINNFIKLVEDFVNRRNKLHERFQYYFKLKQEQANAVPEPTEQIVESNNLPDNNIIKE